ncbi:FxsA family protein [Vreelandella massiliensis]|uniref:FxsA family protein n=1 Tax=Vreelandella massiliensis TaxID=1816686 RepID=UPI00096A9571|nr:FxsA family protein [Halomonas massiliensis]MYL24381.1 FxsA family protein [Halomonas alkaliantarctica]
MPVLLFISLFTLLDFVVLFSIGGQIGLLATLLLILVTGIGGLHLIRREGASTLARAREKMNAGEIPSSELLTGAALIFGGALLMAPGFLSDAIGLACLLPNARRLMLKLLTWFGLKASVHSQQHSHSEWRGEKRADSGSTSSTSDHQEAPLEGDFISREEPHQRR